MKRTLRTERTGTFTKYGKASWPSVWSMDERLQCVAAILADDGIECPIVVDVGRNRAIIAVELLRAMAADTLNNRQMRLACFSAMAEVEAALEAAVLD